MLSFLFFYIVDSFSGHPDQHPDQPTNSIDKASNPESPLSFTGHGKIESHKVNPAYKYFTMVPTGMTKLD